MKLLPLWAPPKPHFQGHKPSFRLRRKMRDVVVSTSLLPQLLLGHMAELLIKALTIHTFVVRILVLL